MNQPHPTLCKNKIDVFPAQQQPGNLICSWLSSMPGRQSDFEVARQLDTCGLLLP